MHKFCGSALIAISAVILPNGAQAAITLNFEDIATYPTDSGVQILEFYNGGTAGNGKSGPNLGVSFTTGAQLLCFDTAGVDCSNSSKGGLGVPGSEKYGMYFSDSNPFMNVADGFDTGFSFAYANPFNALTTVTIFDGLDGSGSILASLSLGQTTTGACLGADYCPMQNAALAFTGIGRSVLFGGSVNAQTFDDFTFGSVTVGAIPEPSTWAMMLLGMGFIGASMRRKNRQSIRHSFG